MASANLRPALRRLRAKMSTPTQVGIQTAAVNIKSQRSNRSVKGPSTICGRGYSAFNQATRNHERLFELLLEANLEFGVIATPDTQKHVFVLSHNDLPKVFATFKANADPLATFRVTALESQRPPLSLTDSTSALMQRQANKHRQLFFFEAVAAPNQIALNTPYEHAAVQFWDSLEQAVPRPDGAEYSVGTLMRPEHLDIGPVTDTISPDQWAHIQTREGRTLDLTAPLANHVIEPVDAVYTWVDGNDPVWQRRMHGALGNSKNVSEVYNATAFSAARFTSHDELRFSLRSLEMNADWIRNIYIVTDNQVPTWLRKDHPRVKIIDHRDIFKDPRALPVFNSHAIESQLHNIPGLSDQFLYLNDDIFFGRPITPELFFASNGVSKFFPSSISIDVSPISADDLPVGAAAKNNRTFIERHFGRTVTTKFKHTPHALLRPVLEDMERAHPALFADVSHRKFRHAQDHSIVSSLYHNYAYFQRRAVQGPISNAYVDLGSETAQRDLIALKEKRNLDVFCLNDTGPGNVPRPKAEKSLRECLKYKFPIPSSFEI